MQKENKHSERTKESLLNLLEFSKLYFRSLIESRWNVVALVQRSDGTFTSLFTLSTERNFHIIEFFCVENELANVLLAVVIFKV